jgi:ribosomal protein S27AE
MRAPTLASIWEKRARANNYRCRRCGMVAAHSERDIFFARGLCGWCAAADDRDDGTRAWERGEPAAAARTRRVGPTKTR